MLAKALHLESFVTHTRSFVGKATGKSNNSKAGSMQPDMHMDSITSGSSGGFHKLHSGHDESDGEAEVGLKDVKGELGIRVMVTITLEMDIESRRGSEGGFYGNGVGMAI